MRLLSWNVASLPPLCALLKSHGGLEGWLKEYGIDICCLQEVKVANPKADKAKMGMVGGARYESFWAVSSASPGQAGVTTLCTTPFSPVTAFPAPFGDPALNAEGRCLVTDHGAFLLYNVYCPYSGERSEKDGSYKDASRVARKAAFLTALSGDIFARGAGRSVIVCGDLNIAIDPEDVHAGRRIWDRCGYSEDENEWLSRLLGRRGALASPPLVDVWRAAFPGAEVFSCFESASFARQSNKGTRIE